MEIKKIEKTEVLAVRMPKSLLNDVRKTCKENKCRQSDFFKAAVKMALEELKKGK